MKNKRNAWYGLAIVMAGLICLSVQAQKGDGTRRAKFQGEWRAKESISMGGNIVCSYIDGDRMRSKTMKITEQAGFLTIEVPNPSPGAAPAARPEKLTLNGKASEIDDVLGFGKKFSVKLSAYGRTMTVNSVVHIMNAQKPAAINVTEVWQLSDDGQSITVRAKAKATLFDEERSWTTVFDKVR